MTSGPSQTNVHFLEDEGFSLQMVGDGLNGSRLVDWTGFDTVCLERPTLPFPRRVSHREEQDADSVKKDGNAMEVWSLTSHWACWPPTAWFTRKLVELGKELQVQHNESRNSVFRDNSSDFSEWPARQPDGVPGRWPSCIPHQDPSHSQPQGDPVTGQVWALPRSSQTQSQSKGTGEDQGESNGTRRS